MNQLLRHSLVRGAWVAAAAALLAACSGGSDSKPAGNGAKTIVLGFSQIGAESEWRTANTTSVQSAAAPP